MINHNKAKSSLRRLAWRLAPASILNLVFGDKLRGMGTLIEASGVADASPIDVQGVSDVCYQLTLEDGTKIVSTVPSPNNEKITAVARQKLGFGSTYSKALVDLIVRYKYPHALVPILNIPVPDRQRGGFHLQHRNLPQESTDFDEATRAFLLDNFTPKPGWNVVDIGCYLGHGATHLAQLVGPSGQILAVEAIPMNAQIAKFQLATNGLDHATVLNNAIWKESGSSISMNVTENQANAIAGDVVSSPKTIQLETTSIAELTVKLGGAADLVSLTVNGAEVEALDSLQTMSQDDLPKRMVMPGWYSKDDRPRSEVLRNKLIHYGYEVLVTKHEFVIAWRPGL